uniref:Uncharacterized protein n=1 Tax=Sphaeramia orbicularis TaxID=375764 RepID=A0A672YC37_9TELE
MLLLIANKVITTSWLKPQPPTIVQWRDRIQDVYNMEYTTAVLQMKREIFMHNWTHIKSHFNLIKIYNEHLVVFSQQALRQLF